MEAYFEYVDYVVDKAASLGLYVGLLPTWGDKVNKKWGRGPEIFTPGNARVYGVWLGSRYRDRPTIWILGGDRPCETPRHVAIYRALEEGLRDGDGGVHLITYHPMGGHSSSEYVNDEPWLGIRAPAMPGPPQVKKEGPHEFSPPRMGETIDWVLILEDPAKSYPEPGTVAWGPVTRRFLGVQ
ncbi:MAG: hypothetical protein QOE70_451 [Chthoniobacter sp.]|nr:hypothetical protein [Chthoniobacter sp.]